MPLDFGFWNLDFGFQVEFAGSQLILGFGIWIAN